MAENEYPYLERPEKLEFPTETWAAQDIRKSDVFCYAAMHAEGGERARYVERARFFYEHSLAELATKPTRTFARPVVVLLTSGQVYPWFAEHSCFSEPAPAKVSDFGSPTVFIPQRRIATRRAKYIVAAMALLGLAGSTWFFAAW
jgi:hypothetical protein